MAGRRDKRALYIYCPTDPLNFPFADCAAIVALGGTDVDPETGDLGNRDFTAGWGYLCVVEVNHSGGANEVDDSDRCNLESVEIRSLTDEFSGTLRKRHNPNDNCIEEACKKLSDLREACTPFYMLMMDCPRTDAGSDGRYIYGHLTAFSEGQGLNSPTDKTFTFKKKAITGVSTINGNDALNSAPVSCPCPATP